MSQGKVVQIIGAVVDVEFPRDAVPKVYDALKIDGMAITLEVQQQLGDGVVRTIALGSTDGLRRNLVARNTGAGIKVPVGTKTLGRIMDVLGNPIDEAGPIGEQERWEIHRAAPSYDEQAAANELREIVPDAEVAVVKEGLGRYSCISLSATAARDAIREASRRSVSKIGSIRPYTVSGPVTLQVEYTTRNSLPPDASLRTGAEVLDDRTIRFRGKDVLEAWSLYRSR